jgi:hypothetical protein
MLRNWKDSLLTSVCFLKIVWIYISRPITKLGINYLWPCLRLTYNNQFRVS